jgi:hypothetical protein
MKIAYRSGHNRRRNWIPILSAARAARDDRDDVRYDTSFRRLCSLAKGTSSPSAKEPGLGVYTLATPRGPRERRAPRPCTSSNGAERRAPRCASSILVILAAEAAERSRRPRTLHEGAPPPVPKAPLKRTRLGRAGALARPRRTLPKVAHGQIIRVCVVSASATHPRLRRVRVRRIRARHRLRRVCIRPSPRLRSDRVC